VTTPLTTMSTTKKTPMTTHLLLLPSPTRARRGCAHPLHGFEVSPTGGRRQRFQPPPTSTPAPPSPPSSSAAERGTRGLCGSSPPCQPLRLGPQPSRDHAPLLRAPTRRRRRRRRCPLFSVSLFGLNACDW